MPETTAKKGKDYPVGPVLLGFFVFVVIGSCETITSIFIPIPNFCLTQDIMVNIVPAMNYEHTTFVFAGKCLVYSKNCFIVRTRFRLMFDHS